MKYSFDVAFLPSENLKDHDVRIVIDILRATSQITTFFDAGGMMIFPVSEIEDAYRVQEKIGSECRLMGERGALPPDGFDFGNSPLELKEAGAPECAAMTTSNGTRALARASEGCPHVITACARNAESAAWDALCSGENIGIICAGTDGQFSFEDTVCAGMIIEKLLALAPSNGGTEMELTDGAMAALSLWQSFGPDMTAVLQESMHGKRLSELGFDNDLFFCGEIDASSVVPVLKEMNGLRVLVGR